MLLKKGDQIYIHPKYKENIILRVISKRKRTYTLEVVKSDYDKWKVGFKMRKRIDTVHKMLEQGCKVIGQDIELWESIYGC